MCLFYNLSYFKNIFLLFEKFNFDEIWFLPSLNTFLYLNIYISTIFITFVRELYNIIQLNIASIILKGISWFFDNSI